MRVTQGTFSYLPDLSDDEIRQQVEYCLQHQWPVSIEHTDDPHPRNVYWSMWGGPLFDQKDPDRIMEAILACRRDHPRDYVRVNGYDRRFGRQTIALSFIVNRPPDEPGFRVERLEDGDRRIRYGLSPYATLRPQGQRY